MSFLTPNFAEERAKVPKIFESRDPLYPRVTITDAAVQAADGDIQVDLDGIHELLRTDLGLEKEVTPKFVLYGKRESSAILGLHVPFTKTAYVNLPSSEYAGSASSTLIHEAVHLVDSLERPIRTAGEVALRWASHKGSMLAGAKASLLLPGPLITDAAAHMITYYNLRMGLYYRHLDPSENRARSVQNDAEIIDKYGQIIRVGAGSGRIAMF